MAPSAAEEALSPRSKELRELEEYLNEHTFDSFEDAFEYFCNSARAEAQAMSQQSSLDNFEAQSVLVPDQAQPVPAPEQAPIVTAQVQYSEGFNEKIDQHGNRWMSEEVMVAFQKYLERKDDMKELDYEFDELNHQCFNVESYCKIFHHFNFTIKMKEPGSSEWISKLYFAEVKEILTQKIYFCCPLEPYESGHCYACKNQGMDDLKHPIIGAFDRGSPDTTFPFMYRSDSSDDEDDEVYDEAWRMRMRAAGVMVG
uniref:DUF3615 domain-containing protein n=1 Tax=Arundo donax TaxID=35708 RepID=A0A0A9A4I1_ARUDO